MNILLWEFGQSLWNPGKLLALSSRGSSSAAGGTVLLLSVCLKPISHRFHLMFHFFSYYRRWGTVVYYSVTICQVFPRCLQFSYSYYGDMLYYITNSIKQIASNRTEILLLEIKCGLLDPGGFPKHLFAGVLGQHLSAQKNTRSNFMWYSVLHRFLEHASNTANYSKHKSLKTKPLILPQDHLPVKCTLYLELVYMTVKWSPWMPQTEGCEDGNNNLRLSKELWCRLLKLLLLWFLL